MSGKMFKYIFVMIVFVCFVKREYLNFFVKHDLAVAFLRETWLLAFFCEREGVFAFFVMREKASYLSVELFSEEV